MNLNKMQALIHILLVRLILNESIEIVNFGKYHLTNRAKKFIYHFNPNLLPKLEGTPAFLFGIFKSHSTKIWIYEDDNKQYTDRFEINSEDKFYCYNIKNTTVQKYTFEISPWSSADFIFIDNTKEINTNFTDFLNLNLATSNSYREPSYPIIFNIDSPAKSIVKFDYYKGNFYNSEYMLEYCKLQNEDNCKYKGIKTTAIFEKGVKYKIKYNCRSYSIDYEFASFSALNSYEIEFSDFNFYQLSSNHKEQYFLLNIKNYKHFSIYIESDIYDIYFKYLNQSDSENIEKIMEQNSYNERVSSFYGDKLFNYNNLGNDCIVFKFKYESSKRNKGI